MPKVLTKENKIKEISDYIANDKQSMAHLGFTLIPEDKCSDKCEGECSEESKCEKEVTREAEPVVEKIANPTPVKRKSKNKINGN